MQFNKNEMECFKKSSLYLIEILEKIFEHKINSYFSYLSNKYVEEMIYSKGCIFKEPHKDRLKELFYVMLYYGVEHELTEVFIGDDYVILEHSDYIEEYIEEYKEIELESFEGFKKDLGYKLYTRCSFFEFIYKKNEAIKNIQRDINKLFIDFYREVNYE